MRIKRWTIVVGIFCFGVLGLPGSSVGESGWYVGGSLGQTSFNHDVSDFDDGSLVLGQGNVDDSDSGWKLFGGYRVGKHLAVEFGYVLLNSDFDSETTFFDGVSVGDGFSFAPGGVGVDIHRPEAVFATAVGVLPLGRNFALSGKVGMQSWRSELTTFDSSGIRENDTSGTDPLVGLGMEYRVWKGLAVRAEWERFMNIIDDDIDLFSFGISYGFGSR